MKEAAKELNENREKVRTLLSGFQANRELWRDITTLEASVKTQAARIQRAEEAHRRLFNVPTPPPSSPDGSRGENTPERKEKDKLSPRTSTPRANSVINPFYCPENAQEDKGESTPPRPSTSKPRLAANDSPDNSNPDNLEADSDSDREVNEHRPTCCKYHHPSPSDLDNSDDSSGLEADGEEDLDQDFARGRAQDLSRERDNEVCVHTAEERKIINKLWLKTLLGSDYDTDDYA